MGITERLEDRSRLRSARRGHTDPELIDIARVVDSLEFMRADAEPAPMTPPKVRTTLPQHIRGAPSATPTPNLVSGNPSDPGDLTILRTGRQYPDVSGISAAIPCGRSRPTPCVGKDGRTVLLCRK